MAEEPPRGETAHPQAMAEEPPRGETAYPQAQHTEEPTKMATDDPKQLHKERSSSDKEHHDGGGYAIKDRRRPLYTFIVIFLILAGVTALILWLVYRPHQPKFRVVSAAVYGLNDTSPPFISAAMQFTVVARNPNKRVSIFYDHLSAIVSYKNQAITPPVILPPFFLETKSTVTLSPLLGGSPVLVAAGVGNTLVMDQDYGVVGLRLVLSGKLRYKAGAIRSERHGMYVKCDLLVGLRRGFVGQLPLLQSPPCIVDV